MPAADTEQRQAGLPVLPGLLWAGVGLAPVAALLVMFGGDSAGVIRVAVLLAVAAVVLIGVSVALRRDPESVRAQVEDLVFEELDVLREDMREDITTAARATHKALGERVVKLQETVEALRGQFDNLRVHVDRAPHAAPQVPQQSPAPSVPQQPQLPPPGVVAPGGVVRHTETVQVTTRQTIVDPNDGGRGGGTVYGSSRAADAPPAPAQRWPSDPLRDARADDGDDAQSWTEQLLRERVGDRPGDRSGDRRDAGRAEPGRYESGRYESGRYEPGRYEPGRYEPGRYEPARPESERYEPGRYEPGRSGSGRPDEDRYDPGRYDEGRYEPGRYDQDRREPLRSRPADDDRARYDEPPRYADARPEPDGRGGGRRRAAEQPDGDADRITGVRATDRWASLRSDDHGRELRVGERRAAVQSDGSGTEIRIEDRWAAVRREDADRDADRRGPGRDDPAWDRTAAWSPVQDPGRGYGRGTEYGGTTYGRDGDRGPDRAADRGGREETSWSQTRYEERRSDEPDRWRSYGSPPALPSTPSEPSASNWMAEWNVRPEPVSERIRRSRHADDDEDRRR